MNAIAILVAGWLALIGGDAEKLCHANCKISQAGIALTQNFEGFSAYPYKDAVGIPTIGYGHVILPGEIFNCPLTRSEAMLLLKQDASKAEKAVNYGVKVPLKQRQADSLISFTFNLGGGKLSSSTLLRMVNNSRHHEAALEFKKWVYAGGIKLKGLVLRREAESLMYEG